MKAPNGSEGHDQRHADRIRQVVYCNHRCTSSRGQVHELQCQILAAKAFHRTSCGWVLYQDSTKPGSDLTAPVSAPFFATCLADTLDALQGTGKPLLWSCVKFNSKACLRTPHGNRPAGLSTEKHSQTLTGLIHRVGTMTNIFKNFGSGGAPTKPKVSRLSAMTSRSAPHLRPGSWRHPSLARAPATNSTH